MEAPAKVTIPRSWGLTRQGWWFLSFLVFSSFLPFLVEAPHLWWIVAALLACVVYSIAELFFSDTHLAGAWLLPREPHAGHQVSIGARLISRQFRRPATLYAWEETVGRYEPTGSIPPAPSGHITRCAWHISFERRGLHRLPPMMARAETGLGLCYRQRLVNKPAQIIVLPGLGSMKRSFRHRLERFMEEGRSGLQEGDDDIIRLRPYQPGDPPQLVQWKASARARQLMVGVRGLPTSRHLALLIDTRSSVPQGQRIERLVSIAATIVDHCLERHWVVSLHGNFAEGGVISGSRSHLMQVLALLQIEDPAGAEEPEAPSGACLGLSLDPSEQLRAQHNVLALDLGEAEELVQLPRNLKRKRR